MKRTYLPRFLSVAATIAVLIAVSGCVAPPVQYPISSTASLRIMNFAPNCPTTSPMDAYWASGPQTPPKNAANIIDLPYGAASVYTTSIPVAASGTPYLVDICPTRLTSVEKEVPITLMPSGKYTIVMTHDSAASSNPPVFLDTILQDAVQPPNSNPKNQTFVRFINLQPGDSLSVHVNDPVTGDAIGKEPFRRCTPYVALNTAQDTSYAFFVTDSSNKNKNKIIARLTYQTFVAGSYYTLVYAGDLCNTPLYNPADTVHDAVDTMRLRAFDDNTGGADQTNPVPQNFRYNVINAITPGPGVSVSSVGFTIAEADFPEFNNFSIPAIPVDYAGGTGTSFSSSDNVLSVNYQSATIPPPPATGSPFVSVVAAGLDASGNSLGQLFSAQINQTSPTYDLAVVPNNSVSYLFYDTVTSKLTSAGKGIVFTVPDASYPDSVTLVFVPAISGKAATNASHTYFYYSVNGGAITSTRWNGTGTKGSATGSVQYTGKPTVQIPDTEKTSLSITITDSLYGTSNGTSAAGKIPFQPTKFTAYPGGIYEVVAMGNINQPSSYKTLIIRVNNQ